MLVYYSLAYIAGVQVYIVCAYTVVHSTASCWNLNVLYSQVIVQCLMVAMQAEAGAINCVGHFALYINDAEVVL